MSSGSGGEPTEGAASQNSAPESIAIPLKAVLDRLPAALKPLAARAAGADEKVTVQTARVLPQLATGAVRITFDELRQGAPADLFISNAGQGSTLVDLPLPDILRAAGPALLKRKSAPKAEPASGSFFAGMGPGAISAPAAVSPPAPVPTPPPASAAPLFNAPAPTPAPTFAPAFSPTPAPNPVAVTIPAMGSGGTTFFRPAAPEAAPAAADTPSLRVSISLATLSAGWPENIRREANELANATVEFPRDELGNAMKTGKVTFTWGQLRSWMNPSVGPSANDATVLPLPLRLLVQPFMSNMRGGEPAKRPVAAEGRTESFVNRAPTPALIVPVAPAPAPPPADSKLGEALGKPDKLTWTPNEIIQAVRQLPGVTGAMLSLQEGHLAAADLNAALPPELLAYGLPKLISATAEQARQMKFGEPAMVSVLAEGHQWAIFKLDKIFFTVMSRKGEPLPLPRLQTIATEIARQRK